MGRIFKTTSDSATEGTLRAIHLANTVDTTYERTWGWIKAIFFSLIASLIVSGYEFYNTDFSFYENSIKWLVGKLESLIDWLIWWN